MTDQARSLTGVAYVAIAASMFGLLGPLTRYAYQAGVDSLAFIGWRSLVGAIAAGAFVAWRRSAQRPAPSIHLDRREGLAAEPAGAYPSGIRLNLRSWSTAGRLHGPNDEAIDRSATFVRA